MSTSPIDTTGSTAPALASNAAPVEFHGVTKVYGRDVRAVDEVSLRVEAGELVTLLGPSGCGKTTTLRMIAGLELPTEGRITIGERDVTGQPATQRDVSMVFQSYALFPHMTVRENVAYGLAANRRPKAEVRARAEDGLALVGLAGYGERLPSELSGGQQQRVAVARALVLEPEVLLFDEPLSNLDAKLRRQVRDDIRELQTRLGLTVVYVTHDQEEALAVSDRIVVMREARIAQIGTPRDLYERPASEFVADFIGEANVLDATIERVEPARGGDTAGAGVAGEGDPIGGSGDGRRHAAVDPDGALAHVSLGALRLVLDARGLAPGPARLAVRPDRFRLAPAGAENALEGVVEKATYVGRHMEYRVATERGTLFVVDADVERALAAGDAVAVRCAEHGPVLLHANA